MSVVQQVNIENALNVGKCYKCVDEVKLAIESYNKNDYTAFKTKSLYKQCTHKARKSDGTLVKQKQHKHKMCNACTAYNKSQRSGDEALKLTKAYLSLLKELDNLENESLKGIDRELVRDLKQANAQLWQINAVLIKKKGGRNCGKVLNEQNKETLSLDALEEFLGSLMEEAEGIESGSNLKDKNKYKMVMPVLMRIGKMISRHPTKQFLSYHEHLGKLEAAIRVGQRNVEDNHFKFNPDLTPVIGNSIEDVGSNIGSASLISDSVLTADARNDLETEV